MDKIDVRLLQLLQEDAARSHAELAEAVHLSPSQCSRRIQKLQDDGYIARQVALLDRERIGVKVDAYVTVSLSSYSRQVVAGFHKRMQAMDCVVECCALTGDADYLLRIVSTDLQAFAKIVNDEILGSGDVASVRSSIVLDTIKRSTAYPLNAIGGEARKPKR